MVFVCALSGCSEKRLSPLDRDDVHFAGFYSDYLLESGVAVGNAGARLSRLDSADINELLARHALNRESLNRKMALYRKNPELWSRIQEAKAKLSAPAISSGLSSGLSSELG